MDLSNINLVSISDKITDTEITKALSKDYLLDEITLKKLELIINNYLKNNYDIEELYLQIRYIIYNFNTQKNYLNNQYKIDTTASNINKIQINEKILINASLIMMKIIINGNIFKNNKHLDLLKILFYLYNKKFIALSVISIVIKTLMLININKILHESEHITVQYEHFFIIHILIIMLYNLKIKLPAKLIKEIIDILKNSFFKYFNVKMTLNKLYFLLLLLGFSADDENKDKDKDNDNINIHNEMIEFLSEIYVHNINGTILNILYKYSFKNITFLKNSLDLLSNIIEIEKNKSSSTQLKIKRGFIITNNNPLILNDYCLQLEKIKDEQILFIFSFRLINKSDKESPSIIFNIKNSNNNKIEYQLGLNKSNILTYKIKKTVKESNKLINENIDYLVLIQQNKKTCNIYLFDSSSYNNSNLFNSNNSTNNANNILNKYNVFSILKSPVKSELTENNKYIIEFGSENFDGLIGDFLIMKCENLNSFLTFQDNFYRLLGEYYIIGNNNVSNALIKNYDIIYFGDNNELIYSYLSAYKYFQSNKFHTYFKLSINDISNESPYTIQYEQHFLKHKSSQTIFQTFENKFTFLEFMNSNGTNFLIFILHYLNNTNLNLDNDKINSIINSLIGIINKLLSTTNMEYFAKNDKDVDYFDNYVKSNHDFLVIFFITLFEYIDKVNNAYDNNKIINKNDTNTSFEDINLNDFSNNNNETYLNLGFRINIKSEIIFIVSGLINILSMSELRDDSRLCSFIIYKIFDNKIVDEECIKESFNELISSIITFFKRCSKHLLTIDFLNKILSFDYILDYKDDNFTTKYFMLLERFLLAQEEDENENKKNGEDEDILIFEFFKYLVKKRDILSSIQKCEYLKFIYRVLINDSTVKLSCGLVKLYKNFIEKEFNNNQVDLNFYNKNNYINENDTETNMISCICYALNSLIAKYNKVGLINIIELAIKDEYYFNPTFNFLKTVFIIIFNEVDSESKIKFIVNNEYTSSNNKENIFSEFKYDYNFPISSNKSTTEINQLINDINSFIIYMQLIFDKSKKEYINNNGEKILLLFNDFISFCCKQNQKMMNKNFMKMFLSSKAIFTFYNFLIKKFPNSGYIYLENTIKDSLSLTSNGFYYDFFSEPNLNDDLIKRILGTITQNLINDSLENIEDLNIQMNKIKLLIHIHNLFISINDKNNIDLINKCETELKLFVPYLVNKEYNFLKYLFKTKDNNKYKSIMEIAFDLYLIMMKTKSNDQYKFLLMDLLLTQNQKDSNLLFIDVPNIPIKKRKKSDTDRVKNLPKIEEIMFAFDSKIYNISFTIFFLVKIYELKIYFENKLENNICDDNNENVNDNKNDKDNKDDNEIKNYSILFKDLINIIFQNAKDLFKYYNKYNQVKVNKKNKFKDSNNSIALSSIFEHIIVGGINEENLIYEMYNKILDFFIKPPKDVNLTGFTVYYHSERKKILKRIEKNNSNNNLNTSNDSETNNETEYVILKKKTINFNEINEIHINNENNNNLPSLENQYQKRFSLSSKNLGKVKKINIINKTDLIKNENNQNLSLNSSISNDNNDNGINSLNKNEKLSERNCIKNKTNKNDSNYLNSRTNSLTYDNNFILRSYSGNFNFKNKISLESNTNNECLEATDENDYILITKEDNNLEEYTANKNKLSKRKESEEYSLNYAKLCIKYGFEQKKKYSSNKRDDDIITKEDDEDENLCKEYKDENEYVNDEKIENKNGDDDDFEENLSIPINTQNKKEKKLAFNLDNCYNPAQKHNLLEKKISSDLLKGPAIKVRSKNQLLKRRASSKIKQKKGFNSYSFLISILQKECTQILLNPKNYFIWYNFAYYFKDELFNDITFKRLQFAFRYKYNQYINEKSKSQDQFHINFPCKILNYTCDDYYRPFVKPILNFYKHPTFQITHSYFHYNMSKSENYLLSCKFIKIQPVINRECISFYCECVTSQGCIYGTIQFTNSLLFFVDKSKEDKRFDTDINLKMKFIFSGDPNDKIIGKNKNILIYLDEISEVFVRRFCFMDIGIEIFLKDKKSFLFNLFDDSLYNKFMEKLTEMNKKKNLNILIVTNCREMFKKKEYKHDYLRRKIDNFSYLLKINKYGYRSYNDIMQYPVFPWLISGINPIEPRNLSKPVCVQKALKQGLTDDAIRQKYKINMDTLKCNFMLHYCNSGYIMHYLIRMIPITYDAIRFQSNQFDQASRIFFSIRELLRVFEVIEDNRELIPEFYFDYNFMLNLNKNNLGFFKDKNLQIHNVTCEGFKNNIEYIIEQRKILDKNEDINLWINNVFGCNQLNEKILNKFPKYTYAFYNNFKHKINKYINRGDTLDDVYKKIRTKIGLMNLGITPYDLFKNYHQKRGEIIEDNNSSNNNLNKSIVNSEISIQNKTDAQNISLSRTTITKESNNNIIVEPNSQVLKNYISEKYDLIRAIVNIDNDCYILFDNKLKHFEMVSTHLKIVDSFTLDIDKQISLHSSLNYSFCEVYKKKIYAFIRYGDKTIRFYNTKTYIKGFYWNCFISAICKINEGQIIIGDEYGYMAQINVKNDEPTKVVINIDKKVQGHIYLIRGIIYNKKLNIIVSYDSNNCIVIKNAYSLNTIMIYPNDNNYGEIKDIKISKYDLLYVMYEKAVICYTFSGIIVSCFNSQDGIIKGFGINDDNGTVILGVKQKIYIYKNCDLSNLVNTKELDQKIVDFYFWKKIKMGFVIFEKTHKSQFINLS